MPNSKLIRALSQVITKLNALVVRYRYCSKFSSWILFGLILFFSLVYGYQDILPLGPQSIHQWRQADCLSITSNYYQYQNKFLEPSIHNLGEDGTGKTISEFPLIYYTIAKIWGVSGQSYLWYRLLVLALFVLALLMLFKQIEFELKDSFYAIWIVLLFFTSPTLVYYANNYLMDIPALSMAILGMSFIMKYKAHKKLKYLLAFSGFFLLAGLLKASALLAFIAVMGVVVLEFLLDIKMTNRKMNKSVLSLIALFTFTFLLVFLWYNYAQSYNSKHNSGNFLIGTLPIWEMDNSQIEFTLLRIKDHLRWDYFRIETFIFISIAFLLSLFMLRRNRTLKFYLLLCACGIIGFCFLFFGALDQHDYYTINLFIIVPFILFGFFKLIAQRWNRLNNSIVFRIILVAFLIHNLDFARRRVSERYRIDHRTNHDFTPFMIEYESLEQYLIEIGIDREQKVVSISDDSINISLYLMNRKGWTNYNLKNDPRAISECISKGASYLVIYDVHSYSGMNIQPYLKNKVGSYQGIDIFKL